MIKPSTILCIVFFCALCIFCYQYQNPPPATNTLLTMMDIPVIENEPHEQPLQHLACIMDGNRRWARQRGMAPWEGHYHGIEKVKLIVEFCIKKNIKYLSLYTLSPENFSRPAQELEHIFDLMRREADKGSAEYIKEGIRVRFIGDRSLFPDYLISSLEQIENETSQMDRLHVNLFFCYGGRQEIAAAMQTMGKKIKEGTLDPASITPQVYESFLWTAQIPDPDLIIRTGCVSRLSNFMLFQAAYSELYMLNCYWPDVTQDDLENIYQWYLQTKRSFGT